MSKLEVQVGAEIKELQSKLSKAENNIKSFGKKAESNLGRLSKASKTASSSLNNLNKGAVNGNSALTSFSRTIQDAPFGIMGVSNNITNLTEQFGYLTSKTGSAGGALKAMLSSLKGFGGVSLAISAVTSLLVVYGDEIFKSTEKVNKLIEATKGLIGSAQSEILTLKTLISIGGNESNSKKERSRALNKINELYGDYLPNLTTENINTKKVANSVDVLSKSLIRQAKIKGLSSRISELYSKRYEIESKNIASHISTLRSLWVITKNFGDVSKASIEGVAVAHKNQAEEIKEVDKQLKKLTDTYSKLVKEDISLDGIFTSSKDKGKGKEKTKEQAEMFVQDIYEDFSTGIDKMQEQIQNKVENTPLLEGMADKFDEGSTLLLHNLQRFSEQATNIINDSLVDAFSGIGEAIGNSLAGAGNLTQNLGSALLGTLGSLLSQLGKMAIAVGISLKAIKTALKSLNPAVAIGAGVALVALGSAFSSKASQLGSSIGGGGSSTGSNAGSSVGSSGGSFTAGAGGFNGGGTVVFEIAGQKLVGVLSNTLRRNRSLGGSLSIP